MVVTKRRLLDRAWGSAASRNRGGMLEGTSREVFRRHLEIHVPEAIRAGRREEIVDELMETLNYDKRFLRPQSLNPEHRRPPRRRAHRDCGPE